MDKRERKIRMSEAPEIKVLTAEDSAVAYQKLHDLIYQLALTEDGEPLKQEMQNLKRALLENPTACALLLPEDIGEMVKHLMKITGRDLEMQQSESSKKKGNKPAKIDFSDPKVLEELEKDLF